MLVQQILKSKSDDGVVTIAPGESLSAAAKLLTARRIGAVVVSPDGKRVVGIVSERDIVREIAQKGVGCLADKLDSVMTRDIVTCRRDDTADAVLGLMT